MNENWSINSNYVDRLAHREQESLRFVVNEKNLMYRRSIKGVDVCVLELKDGWYIGEVRDMRNKFKDLGPFKTAEEALVLLRLIQD